MTTEQQLNMDKIISEIEKNQGDLRKELADTNKKIIYLKPFLILYILGISIGLILAELFL